MAITDASRLADFASNVGTGVTFNGNDILVAGVVTATSFVGDSGTSSQFLKADGSVDSSTYLTSYSETSTLDNVLGRGNVSEIGLSVGVVTATSFDGSLLTTDLTGTITNDQLAGFIANAKLSNDSVSYGGVSLDLGGTNATPAFDLSAATNYPYTSLTGITTEIVGDTSPQLGGNLDINSKYIIGTGGASITGVVTATSFVGNVTGTATTAGGLSGTPDITVNNIYVGGIGTFGGAITYEDVTNVDSVGIVTAGKGVRVTTGGLVVTAGVSTFSGIGTFGSDVYVDGNLNVTGIITATTFSGNLLTTDLTGTITNDQLAGFIANAKLSNDSVSYGGVSLDLGGTNATPAFDLSAATNYPYTSLTGITTEIVGDTTPQLGGDLDGNSKSIYGVGIITATTFSGAVTGTATTATNLADGANITTGIITSARLGSGVDAAKFLRGDGTWQTVSSGGLGNIVEDTTPQLGGDLDGNSKSIYGVGIITATTFSGAVTGDVTGTATTATNLADGANITTGTINVARLGSGVDAAKFLRGDNTWQTVSSASLGMVLALGA